MTASFLLYPDPRLKRVCAPVTRGTFDEADVEALFDVLIKTPTIIGLGASQIGLMKQIAIIDLMRTGDLDKGLTLLNPEIISMSDESEEAEEANPCLPGVRAFIKRPRSINVRYQTPSFEIKTLKAEGLLARCLCHEIDHLNGLVFIDHLSRLKKQRALKKLQKAL